MSGIFPTNRTIEFDIDRTMGRLFDLMQEESLTDNPCDWRLGPNEYYDFLESAGIGHKRIRKYVREMRAGERVCLTKTGVELARTALAAAPDKPQGE